MLRKRVRKSSSMSLISVVLRGIRLRSGYLLDRNHQFQQLCTSAAPPLAGIRVLDNTRILAGPFCCMLLADLGAEVIKIEKPGSGDDTRTFGPPFMGDESVYFFSVNRNKKSMTVNFTEDEGKEIIRKLVAQSDVFIENYVPGKLDSLGLGYDDLSAINPALIYCSVSGFGPTGPYAKRGGYDVIAAAMSGLMHITGPREGGPVRVGVAMTDLSTGLYAHGAIMAALLHRKETGKGQKIDCNLISTQVSLLTHLACNFLNAGREAQRWGTAHESIVPYQAFDTSDGMIVVGAGNNRHFRSLCEKMGLQHLLEDKRFSDNSKRVKHRNELLDLLHKRFAEQSTSEWLACFQGSNFPYGPINNFQQVFSDPQVKHLDVVKSTIHSTVGEIKFPGPAVSYTAVEQPVRLPPPTLGQHTDELLEQLLQYDRNSIDMLRGKGVI